MSFIFGLTGPSEQLDTACSSSLVALGTAQQFSRLRASITMLAMRLASYAVVFELAAALVQLVPSVSTDVAGAGTVDVAVVALALAVSGVDATVHRQHVRRARWACWLAVFLTLRCVDLLLSGQFVGDVFSFLHSDVLVGMVACTLLGGAPVVMSRLATPSAY